ncbi:conserved hypothetical protein [uncultured Gammaproteobacteria bacterium]
MAGSDPLATATTDTVAAATTDSVAAATAALAWFTANSAQVAAERASLDREFRRHVIAARKLEAAVTRPMCAGVFGISQAGKSFLISALARKGTSPLLADLGQPIDFLKEINPESKKEATGVVTRFTLRRPVTPPGSPVALRLLSQIDIIKILGNAYFLDGHNDDEVYLDRDGLAGIVATAERAAVPNPVDGLTTEDVWDLQDYFQSRFKRQRGIEALGDGYWDRLAELAPRLPISERVKLLAPLWNRIEPFSALYVRLAEGLRGLNFPADAFCGLDALTPKQDSVINVDTLGRLGAEDNSSLSVRTLAGAESRFKRGELTALIAELQIPLVEEPWPFFRHTDLLDFPGARSRMEEVIRTKLERTPAALSDFFLRGKVAYLFERYCAERELTSMLLCLGPSNNEVATMKSLVGDWIAISHGRTPDQRQRQETALFVVMTKFDTIFEETAGTGGSSKGLWTGRLNASLLLPFGTDAGSWVREWQPGQPFNNCFWVRNPNFFAKHLLDYDTGMHEAGIRPSEAARVARYRADSLASDLVRRHFRDPAQAFDQAMRLNDGGIGHLAMALEPVCNPEIKCRQISGQLADLRQAMRARLARFHVTSDIEELLIQRRTEAKAVVECLLDCVDWQRFGLLLAQLQVNFPDMADVWYRVSATRRGNDATPPIRPARLGPAPSRSRIRGALFEDAEANESKPATAAVPSDRADQFAELALQSWVSRMRQTAQAPDGQAYFCLPARPFSILVDELVASAGRLRLRHRLADQVRKATAFIEHHDVSVGRPVTIACRMINDHVNYLGYHELPGAERPQFGKGTRRHPLFAPQPAVGAVLVLAEQAEPFAETYVTDWLFGFTDLVERNVRAGADGSLIDIQANTAMGDILRRLEATTKAL